MKLSAIMIFILIIIPLVDSILFFNPPTCPDIPSTFDYIVVGAGSAGAAVAARLSEDPNQKVLLLEAGEEPTDLSYVPLTSWQALDTEMDWKYETVPQENCCGIFKNRINPMSRGKTLGGTSSINAMFYTRPPKADLDYWESLGNTGWGYDENFRYLLKLEDYQVPHSFEEGKYHTTGGPITASSAKFKTSISHAFIKAGMELGYNQTDVNGRYPIGFSHIPSTTRDGKRCNTYVGYLVPALNRSNLKIVTNALVTKVLFDAQKKANGVKFEWKSAKCNASAAKEVILSAGVFNSPKLLMLSGIGPKDQLAKFNIPLIKDLPGVGQNLHDHVVASNQIYNLNQDCAFNTIRDESLENRLYWDLHKTGPFTSTWGCEAYAFFPTSFNNESNLEWVSGEIQLCSGYISRIALTHIDPILILGLPPIFDEVAYLMPILLKPYSRGSLTLKSSDPHEPPIIDPNILGDPRDVEIMLEIVKKARAIAYTNVFQKYVLAEYLWGFIPQCLEFTQGSDDFLRCTIKFMGISAWHPSGTCKMGISNDTLAVVDNRLRVYGVSGLRVVDGSIMPFVTSSHTNVACIMIGEKASDMIKEDNQ